MVDHLWNCCIVALYKMHIFMLIYLLCIVHQMEAEKPQLHHLTKREKHIILTMHNVFRQRVAQGRVPSQPKGNIRNLTWDEDLTKFATYYIQETIINQGQCPEDHSPDPCWYHGVTVDRVGGNIAWTNQPFLRKVIRAWFKQHLQYVYGPVTKVEESSKPKTGHYTQMIWAKSQKIGCAIASHCVKNNRYYGMMLLCNYSPGGNVIGEYPYHNEHYSEWSPYADPCQRNEIQLDNWDFKNRKLKTVAQKPYFGMKLLPNSIGIYKSFQGQL